MAFASIQAMDGDPQELLRRKETTIDPVMDELAPAHGALLSITGSTSRGIVVITIWESEERAKEFDRHPLMVAAQTQSRLPAVALIQSLEDIDVKDYLAP